MAGGGSGGGGTTQQQNQYSNISPWAAPYVGTMLGAAQQQVFNMGTDASGNPVINGINPYNAFGTTNAQTGGQYGMSQDALNAAQSSVAGFTPLQQQAFQGTANLQTPGQFGQATGAAGMGTMQALGAGQNYQNMATDPNAVGAYMNPYVQQSLAPQLQLLAQQTGINSADEQGAATSRGAFGGSREALMNNLSQQSGNLAAQQAIGQGYNTAYNTALQNMQYGAGLGLQGAQAGITGANALANIGTGQLGAQQNILSAQQAAGATQQQQQQNVINQAMQNYQTAMQYPMTQLTNVKNMITGLPLTDVTTTTQQAAPSLTSSIAGLATIGGGVAGAYNAGNKAASGNKRGGKIKSSNGLADLGMYNAMKSGAIQ